MRICGLLERGKKALNKFFTMLKTELKLSFRGMDMVIFALCMPVVVALILGVIYGAKTAAPEVKYTFLEQIIGHCDLCGQCDGASAVDFRLPPEKDIKKIQSYACRSGISARSVGDDLCSLLAAVPGPCFWSFIHIFWMQVQRIGRDFPAHVSSGDVFDVQHRTYGGRCCA